VKYDRDLMATTLKAIKTVENIKESRQKAFYRQRMVPKKIEEAKAAMLDLQKHREVLPSPAAAIPNGPLAIKVAAAPIQTKMQISN
jgi:large subunit ribosomal protein L24e